jgi:hypothetical protein
MGYFAPPFDRPQLDEPPQPESGVPAPSVVEFDAQGNFIRGWGGPFAMSDAERANFDWPAQEHGIAVDAKDNVWICGNGRDAKNGKDDNQCLKFTVDGKFLMQIGKSAQSKGSLDTANLNHASWPGSHKYSGTRHTPTLSNKTKETGMYLWADGV